MDWLMGRSKKKEKENVSNGCIASDNVYKLKICEEDLYDHLVEKNLQPFTTLPSEIDYNEWVASNTLSFFENLNTLYACLTDVCTSTFCPSMSGPGNIQYLWVDEKGRQCKCSAPQYVDCVMTNVYKYTQDETIFPTKYGNVFPANFDTTVRRINRLLSHVFVHVLHRHAPDLRNYQLSAHFNTLLYHFLHFIKRFQLVPIPEISVFDDVLVQFDKAHNKRTAKILSEATLGTSAVWQSNESIQPKKNTGASIVSKCDKMRSASDRSSLVQPLNGNMNKNGPTELQKRKSPEGSGKNLKNKQLQMSDLIYRYQDMSAVSSCV